MGTLSSLGFNLEGTPSLPAKYPQTSSDVISAQCSFETWLFSWHEVKLMETGDEV